MRHTILAYNMAGEYIFEFGGRGFNPGWFNFPNDIAINNEGQLIIADLFNRRVQVLEVDKEGVNYYLEHPSIEAGEETPAAEESAEDDGNGLEQPEDSQVDAENGDVSLEEMYQTIKEEKSGFEDEIIFEEEVFEEPPEEEPEPPGPFDEPLNTPEEYQGEDYFP
jgi:hypothetical protein